MHPDIKDDMKKLVKTLEELLDIAGTLEVHIEDLVDERNAAVLDRDNLADELYELKEGGG